MLPEYYAPPQESRVLEPVKLNQCCSASEEHPEEQKVDSVERGQ
jgi:hypothetical protein